MKIGILDSGVGGLSVLKEIRSLLPAVDVEYVADSAWCPYGDKPYEAIHERVTLITDKLIDLGCEIIVIACNSATIAAVQSLRASYPIPFVGMEPAVKPAAKRTKTGVIGILATEASLAGDKFLNLVSTHADELRVVTQPCPEFVNLVEKGITSGAEVEASIEKYTSEMVEKNVDTIVLGCTHYPFLKESITKVIGEHIQLLDTGEAVAQRVYSLVSTNGDSSAESAGTGKLMGMSNKGKSTIHTSSNSIESAEIIDLLYPAYDQIVDLQLN